MEGYLAQVIMFAGNFAPRGWAFCQGQILSIAQNTALFSLLGTTYGGNGQTTFALPDFRGRSPVGTGQGPGLSNISLGQVAGTETVTLLPGNLPPHSHSVNGVKGTSDANTPNATLPANASAYSTQAANAVMNATMIGNGPGQSQPVPIRNPYLGMNFVICMQGIFPSRN
jgi:microcystin-dependent protein